MKYVLWVAVGGSIGAVGRYLISSGIQKWAGTSFPLGTLTVNLVGCFLLGLLAALFTGPLLIREEYRLALLVGGLGAFTTFSTYGYETLTLMNDGQKGLALFNIGLSNVLGLTAVWFGLRVAEFWHGG